MRASLVALLVLLLITTAQVGMSVAEERVTDNTAFTLERGEIRLGVLRSGVGVRAPRYLSGLEISTYLVPWAALLADSDALAVQVVNGQVKGSRVFTPKLTGAAAVTVLHGKVGTDEGDGTLLAIPLEAYINYDIRDWISIGGLLQYTHVSISGHTTTGSEEEADEAGRFSAEATLRTSTVHVGVTSEIRATPWLSLLSEARVTSFGRVTGSASSAYMVDDNTMVDGFVDASAKPFKFGYSVKGVAHVSLGWANLRIGVSYGNYVMPLLNFAVPIRYVMPVANLYLRI